MHPDPIYHPVASKVVLRRMRPSLEELREAAIRPNWQAYRVLTGKERHKHFGLIRLDPDRPCPTIPKSVGGSTTGLVHPVEIRRIAICEAQALASFPAGFRFVGNYAERWARIGNSVPPLFMRTIARHIREHIPAMHGERSGDIDTGRTGNPFQASKSHFTCLAPAWKDRVNPAVRGQ
jgi:DNA (cytosine-5)-methyltransferase 1